MSPEDSQSSLPDSDEEDERFLLTGRTEMIFALNDLIHRGELVTVSFNQGADLILTTLLSVDRDDGTVVFDWGGSEESNRKLLNSGRNIFVAKPDGIKVQFVTGEVEETSFGNRKAFVTDLPQRIVRLQRRESFRVLAPLGSPLTCRIVADEQSAPLLFPVHDLGIGGAGLNLPHPQPVFEPGRRLAGVRIELPDAGEIACSAQVRHATPLDTRGSGPVIRVGLRFDGLSHEMQARIQRYIVAIERARRSMTPD
ncbi:MAG: flagellar brake protein [Proteobacteria bacterium]|nr:flagellar brake protein [Pseudomonadota bacterium]